MIPLWMVWGAVFGVAVTLGIVTLVSWVRDDGPTLFEDSTDEELEDWVTNLRQED